MGQRIPDSLFRVQTIPASFVRQHGGRFSVNCKLGYAETKPRWEVTVQVNFMKNNPHVSFGGGWKAFARAHNIQVGDRLKFTLIEQGGFNVHHVTADGTTVIDISSDED